MQGITHIRVTNGNDFTIEDRYDGVLYTFEPGKPRLVPLDAGSLIFGISLDEDGTLGPVVMDRAHVERRWGWNTIEKRKDEEMTDAVSRTLKHSKALLDKIAIEAVSMALREVRVDQVDELPPPREMGPETAADSVVQSKTAGKMTIRG